MSRRFGIRSVPLSSVTASLLAAGSMPTMCLPGRCANRYTPVYSGLTISRLEGGKVVEEFQNWDTFGMMRQLDAVPEMAHA